MRKWIYHPEEKAKIIDTDKVDIAEFYDAGWADSPADFAGKKEVAPAPDTGLDDSMDEDEAEELAATLILKFKADPGSLSVSEHVQLGAAVGVHLMPTWKQETMIKKISEVLANGGNA